MSRPIAIYHKDCIDGTASAAVFLKAFPGGLTFPLMHGYTDDDIAPIYEQTSRDTDCYILDCSLGKEVLVMGTRTLTIIDHHEPQFNELLEWKNASAYHTKLILDPQESGATLTWKYFFPNEPIPELLLRVKDIDLWQWQYEDSGAVAAYLSILRNMPEQMVPHLDNLESVSRDGSIMKRATDDLIARYLEKAEPVLISIDSHDVLAFNTVGFESEIGNALSEKYGQAVMLYRIRGEKVFCNFRSKSGHVPNALTLAHALGGAGHDNAAGARLSLESFLNRILSDSITVLATQK